MEDFPGLGGGGEMVGWLGWEILDIKLNSFRVELGFGLSSATWMVIACPLSGKVQILSALSDCAPFCGHNEPDSN